VYGLLIDLQIEFRGDRVWSRSERGDYGEEIGNFVAINTESNLVEAIGMSRSELVADFPRELEAWPAELNVRPIWSGEGAELEAVALAVSYLRSRLHSKVRPRLGWILRLFDRFEIDVHLPGYENLAEALRGSFEKSPYLRWRLRRLTVNGRVVR